MSIPQAARTILDFIGTAEAPRGYGTIFGNHQTSLPKPLTEMTLDAVLAAQKGWARKYGGSACGRYQFIPSTLKALKVSLKISGRTKFDASLQDRLGLALLMQRGYVKFMAGGPKSREAFALGLAREWASMPVLSPVKGGSRQVKRGQSYYSGDGVNKALVKPEVFEAMLDRAHRQDGHGTAPVPVPKAPDLDDEIAAALRSKSKLEAVQQSLEDFGYPPGGIDGVLGPLTVAALTAYQHDRGLPVSDKIDLALIKDMQTAEDDGWTRPISEERAKATTAEIAKKSDTMKVTWYGKVLAFLGLGGGAAGNAVKGLLDDPTAVDNHLSVAQRVFGFVGENWPLLLGLGVVGISAFGVFQIVDHFRIKDYRTGVKA